MDKVYLTQSGLGAVCFCKWEVCQAIHFEDDLWLEKYGFALPDDQVFFYKMNLAGYKVIHTPMNQFVHLNAQSGAVSAKTMEEKKQRNQKLAARNFTLFWVLYIYRYRHGWERFLCILTLIYKIFATLLWNFALNLAGRHWKCLSAHWNGYVEAFKEMKQVAAQVRRMPAQSKN